MPRLAIALGKVTYTDPATIALGKVSYIRGETEDEVPMALGAVTYAAESIADAMEARPRWARVRLAVGGKTLSPASRTPPVSWMEGFDQPQAEFDFEALGPVWGIPTVDAPPASGDPSAPPPPPPPPSKPPRSYGNPRVEVYFDVGASPAARFTKKAFDGYLLQKETDGQIVQKGPMKALDSGLAFAKVPFCLTIPQNSGLHRGEITMKAWLEIGGDPAKLSCPLGSIVNGIVTVQNRYFQEWVNEFWAPEICFGRWRSDDQSAFEIFKMQIKAVPDWTWDERKGDFDLNTFKEMPPSLPPRRLFASGSFPKATGGAPVRIATVRDVTALHSLECAASYPGAHLWTDGTYHVETAPKLMKIAEIHSILETTDGLETYRATQVFGYMAALSYDRNFGTNPAGSDYSAAFGDHTFRDTPVETWREISLDALTTVYDQNGTFLSSTPLRRGWYDRQSVMRFFPGTAQPLNSPGSWVFPGGTARVDQNETYQDIAAAGAMTYAFRGDGIAASMRKTTAKPFAQRGRMSIFDADGQGSGTQPPDAPSGSTISITGSLASASSPSPSSPVSFRATVSVSGLPQNWGGTSSEVFVAVCPSGVPPYPIPLGGGPAQQPPSSVSVIGTALLSSLTPPGGNSDVEFALARETIFNGSSSPPIVALYVNISDGLGHAAFAIVNLGGSMFKPLAGVPGNWMVSD